MLHRWKLSSFDTFCLGMNIKSAWVFNETPDLDRMESSLEKLAETYPILKGRYDEKEKSVIWNETIQSKLPFSSLDIRDYSVSQLSGNAKLVWSLVKPFSINKFKKGSLSPFSATLGHLKDGCILYVQCAHAIMDAHTFYSLVRQWSELYKGNEIDAMTVDQCLIPSRESYSRETTLRLVKKNGWPLIKFGQVVKMLLNLVRNNSIKGTTVFEVSQDELSRLRIESGAGTNAVLSAVTLKKIAERIPGKNSFKMLFTADLRGRINGIGEDFFGNMSQPAVIEREIPADMNISSIARIIGQCLDDALVSDNLVENVRLSQCSSHYGLPFAPFDASDMNCPGNGTIIINNFLKFRANEISWGNGRPAYTFTNQLSDMVKFWQPVSEGPIQIIFGGYAAKLMKKSKLG